MLRNPDDPSSFDHKWAKLSTGHTYHYIDEFNGTGPFDPKTTPTLLCLHGFPDLWYGWRHQIGPWTSQGWRIIVPDMLGYGGTDKPEDIRYYTSKSLSDDMAALLDHIAVPFAVVLGHDWGSEVAWRFAMWHPQRCRAMVNLSIPYVPPSPRYRSLEDAVQKQPNFGYQLYFNDKKSTDEIQNNLQAFFSAMYQTPSSSHVRGITRMGELQRFIKEYGVTKGDEAWNSDMNMKETQYILDNYRKGGMTGPLNYYRTTKLRFEDEREGQLSSQLPHNIPWLFIYGSRDSTCSKKHVSAMKTAHLPQLQQIVLEGKGHWVMLEGKEEVTQAVIEFVKNHVERTRAKL